MPAIVPCPTGPPRSEGYHLSKVLRNIAVENKVLDPKWLEDFSLVEVDVDQEGWWAALEQPTQLRMAIGLAWEQWYFPKLEGIVYQPGEMEVAGVYMTHDGESLDAIVSPVGTRHHYLGLHECKTTSKSTKTVGDLSTQWLLLAQTKGYCKGLKTCVAYIHMLFLYGDYSYPMTPQLKIWKVTFTQAEIDDNWEVVIGYIRHRQQQEREDLMKDTY